MSQVGSTFSPATTYFDAITNAQHFVYIENQFFITATSDAQHPVGNKIGAAIADRIVRAHREGEDFRVVVVMPAVPAFAGDLHSDGALGTRAIMEYQYNSISRGGHSIMEAAQRAGVDDPSRYIGFYNLRSYDRINESAAMGRAEAASGVSYGAARREFDDAVEAGYDGYGPHDATVGRLGDQYQRYQAAAAQLPAADARSWDSVAACYMDSGPDLRAAPWAGTPDRCSAAAMVAADVLMRSSLRRL